jgi:hypothetical protein
VTQFWTLDARITYCRSVFVFGCDRFQFSSYHSYRASFCYYRLSKNLTTSRRRFSLDSTRFLNIGKESNFFEHPLAMKWCRLIPDLMPNFSSSYNSRMMPGKNDTKKTETGHIQKRILNDSMLFLHLKFKTESPNNISLATFWFDFEWVNGWLLLKPSSDFEWVNGWLLFNIVQQLFSYIMARTSSFLMRWWWGPLCFL